ncbi:unnamed protein product, partial [Ectocarpus sp. 12 AP-2014]
PAVKSGWRQGIRAQPAVVPEKQITLPCLPARCGAARAPTGATVYMLHPPGGGARSLQYRYLSLPGSNISHTTTWRFGSDAPCKRTCEKNVAGATKTPHVKSQGSGGGGGRCRRSRKALISTDPSEFLVAPPVRIYSRLAKKPRSPGRYRKHHS